MTAGRIAYDASSGNPTPGQIWQFRVRCERLDGIVYGETAYQESIPVNKCEYDENHVTQREYVRIVLDLFGGPDFGDFVPVGDFQWIVATDEFVERLRKSGLHGWKAEAIVHLGCDQRSRGRRRKTLHQLYFLEFAHEEWRSSRLKVVAGQNRCPHCFQAPMVCPGCAENNWPFCKRCGRATLYNPDHPEYSDPRGYALENYPPAVSVVDGNIWDGSDFFYFDGVPFVSERARRWLNRVGAEPIEIKEALISQSYA